MDLAVFILYPYIINDLKIVCSQTMYMHGGHYMLHYQVEVQH